MDLMETHHQAISDTHIKCPSDHTETLIEHSQRRMYYHRAKHLITYNVRMAYTRDIPFEDSSRAQRRRQSHTLETKALPKIGDIGFDPKAEDGDGDGKVQDSSAFERPALPIPSLTLSSTTGGNGSDSDDDTPKVVAPRGPVAPQPMPRTSMQVERNKDGVRVLRGKWSPLQGSDWLRDSTREDIAEALVPYSLDDAIALMTQILCYGEIPRDKMEVLKIKAYIKQGLLKGFSGEIEWDFSPEGRLAMKNTIIKSMEESPGFEFMIRTYGAPAMMWTDPLGRDKLYARGVDTSKWGIFHQGYSKQRNRQEGAGNGASIMGASLGNLVIAMNGSNPNMIADRDTGYGIESPNTGESSITGIKQDFVNNFGLSRQDTLRHEYGHWFWSFHMGSPFMYGASNMPPDVYATPARKRDRAERALFISNATGETVEQVLDRMNGLKWRFEESREIISSNAEKNATLAQGLGYIDIQRGAGGQITVVMLPHPDAPYKMGGLSKRGKPLWRATVGRIVEEGERRNAGESAFVWAPQDTWDTASTLAARQDKETGFSEYSLYPLPELRGAYANSTAQELFAEAVAIFLSPKRDLWEEYLTPSMVIALSEAFNIPIRDGKLSPIWDTSRRGLASRSSSMSSLMDRNNSELPIKAKARIAEQIDAKQKEVSSLEELNSSLVSALRELDETGAWEGEKYNIYITEGNKPVTYSAEELKKIQDEEPDVLKRIKKDADNAIYDRNVRIKEIKDEETKLKERLNYLENTKQEKNSFHIDELLADGQLSDELRRRSAEIRGMTQSERSRRFTDEETGETYVIHWGASSLVGGVLDPKRSRGIEGESFGGGNTRALNTYTAKAFADELKNTEERLNRETKILNRISSGEVLQLSELSRSEKLVLQKYFGRFDELYDTQFPRKEDLSNPEFAEKIKSRIDGIINNEIKPEIEKTNQLKKLAAQLKEDDWQYMSSYPASAMLELWQGYGGRYADEGADMDSASVLDSAAMSPVTGIHVFKIKQGVNAWDFGSGDEIHLVGEQTPVASLIADNDASNKNPAIGLWEGWVDAVIEQDKNKASTTRSSLASRSSRVVGRDFETISAELKLTEAERWVAEDELVERMDEVISGEVAKRPMHSQIEKDKKRLLDSIRIEVGDDNIPMIMADPNPLLFQYIPDKRDWSKVRVPAKETIVRVAKHIKENQGDPLPEGDDVTPEIMQSWIDKDEKDTAIRDKFTDRLLTVVKDIAKNGGQPDIGEEVGTGWLSLYLGGLSDPSSLFTLEGGAEQVHDAFGHAGIGRGFDRHGEWANPLAVISMLDNPMFDDFTPEMKNSIALYMFREFGVIRFEQAYGAGWGGTYSEDTDSGQWQQWINGYTGDIRTLVDMVDDSDRTQVLNKDGSRRGGLASASSKPLKNATKQQISEIAEQDARHKKALLSNATGMDSSGRAKDIIDALVEDPSLYDLAPKKIPKVIFDMVGGDPEQFRGARIRNVKPQGMWTEERIMELVNQIRIEPSPDGIFTTIAPPVPEFQSIIGFDGDFSNVRIPSPEARIRMYKSILENLQDYASKPDAEGGQKDYRKPYSEIFGEKISESVDPFLIPRYEYLDLRESLGEEYTPGTDADSFDAIYERFLRVPSDMMFIREMYQQDYIQTMHDVVGHFGTGRGFDRHGEWANFLAMVHASQNIYGDNAEYMDALPFDLFYRIMIDQLARWEEADMNRGVPTAEEALGLLDDISKKASKMYIDGETMKKIIQLDNPDTYMPVQTKSLLDEPLRKRAVAYIHSLVDNNTQETGRAHSSFVQSMPKKKQEREVKGKTMDWVSISTKSFLNEAPSLDLKSLAYTKPEVRERLKNRIMAGDKGGRPGQWSARKAQLLALEYRKAGGGYRGGVRKTQRSLKKWTREKWRTSDGKNAIRKGGTRRYLPASAWQRLTPAQRAATNRKKTIGSRRGNQFVANTESARSASRSARKN